VFVLSEYRLSLWESTEERATTFEFRTSQAVKLADKSEQVFTKRIRMLAKNPPNVCPSVCL
jgi:hypothetical protein